MLQNLLLKYVVVILVNNLVLGGNRWEQTRALQHVKIVVGGDFTVEICLNLSCEPPILGNVTFSNAS